MCTCYVYVKEEWLDKLPSKEDGEEDMLDMAFEPKNNSRLSLINSFRRVRWIRSEHSIKTKLDE